jgi:hypothetical protein
LAILILLQKKSVIQQKTRPLLSGIKRAQLVRRAYKACKACKESKEREANRVYKVCKACKETEAYKGSEGKEANRDRPVHQHRGVLEQPRCSFIGMEPGRSK